MIREDVFISFYSALTHFMMVALGQTDGYISTNIKYNCWDFIPGAYILQKAGARVEYKDILRPAYFICTPKNIFEKVKNDFTFSSYS